MVKKITLLVLTLVGWGSLTAQQVWSLYAGLPPGNTTLAVVEEKVTTDVGREALRRVTIPTLTFYPAHGDRASAAPVVIICPGGGYHRLSIFDGGYDVAAAFAAQGIHAAVLKYRTFTPGAFHHYAPLPLQDLQTAYQLLKTRGPTWGIDTARIGLVGFSAGGHLAAMASTPTLRLPLAFQVLVYPVISFADALISPRLQSRKTLLGAEVTAEQKLAYSPERFVEPGHPATFLVHAMNDSTSYVENSLVYYQALLRQKIPAQMILYQKGGHGFALHNREQDESWFPAVIKWLKLNNFIPQ